MVDNNPAALTKAAQSRFVRSPLTSKAKQNFVCVRSLAILLFSRC
jgi:hypothetical protein